MTDVLWAPQPGPQTALIHCPVPEVLFGGARGGGKTDGIVGKYLLKALRYGRGFNGIIFRKTMPSADDLWDRACELWGPCGGQIQKVEKNITLPDGARLRLRPLESIRDADKYQGQNLTDAAIEEAGQFETPAPIDRIQATLRSTRGVPTQLLMSANPGGAGHHWLKQRFIDPWPAGNKVLHVTLANGEEHHRVFIPSRVRDNRILMQNDPGYLKRLQLVGSAQLVKAWVDGDWSVIEGAFFDCWSSALHVLRPVPLPSHWVRFRAMDWGSAAPFSIGWYAVASEDMTCEEGVIPKGALVRYREWYGASGPNVGLKMQAADVARRIADLEAGETMDYATIDPACFAHNGGPSIVELMAQATGGTVRWRPADNTRVGSRGHLVGWEHVRSRLIGHDGRPMLYFFSTCTEAIRTLPVVQHDAARPEDVDTDGEDHVADEVRYACASRPWTRPGPAVAPKPRGIQKATWAEIMQAYDEGRLK